MADEKEKESAKESLSIAEIAGVLVPDLDREWGDLALEVHPVLRPVLGQPFLGRLLGELKRIGVQRVRLFANRYSYQIADFVGDGKRWGLEISLQTLGDLSKAQTRFEKWRKGQSGIWLSGDTIPHITKDGSNKSDWELLGSDGSLQLLSTSVTPLSCETPALFRRSVLRLLRYNRPDIVASAANPQDGVWMGRNVVIHPSAKITGPIYLGKNTTIGPKCTVGPYLVLEDECILSDEVIAKRSIILPETFVGVELELDEAIAAPNSLSLADAPVVAIADNFMLGSAKNAARLGFGMILGMVAAGLLFLLTLPILLVLTVLSYLLGGMKARRRIQVVRTPCSANPLCWKTFSITTFEKTGSSIWDFLAGYSFFNKLPLLLPVALGRMAWVGFPPSRREEIIEMEDQERLMTLSVPIGFTSLVEIDRAQTGDHSIFQQLASKAVYVADNTRWRDLRLAIAGLTLILIPRKPENSNTTPPQRLT